MQMAPSRDMLLAHTDHIGATLHGVQQQCKGEPLLGADRPMRFEGRDFVSGPGVMTIGLGHFEPDAGGRVGLTESFGNGKGHESPDGLEPVAAACGFRRANIPVMNCGGMVATRSLPYCGRIRS
jgi:hypothetical protein